MLVSYAALESGVEVETDIDVAAQDARDELRRRLVRDDDDIRVRRLFEQMSRQVLGAAGIDRAQRKLARILPGKFDNILQCLEP